MTWHELSEYVYDKLHTGIEWAVDGIADDDEEPLLVYEAQMHMFWSEAMKSWWDVPSLMVPECRHKFDDERYCNVCWRDRCEYYKDGECAKGELVVGGAAVCLIKGCILLLYLMKAYSLDFQEDDAFDWAEDFREYNVTELICTLHEMTSNLWGMFEDKKEANYFASRILEGIFVWFEDANAAHFPAEDGGYDYIKPVEMVSFVVDMIVNNETSFIGGV